MTGTALLGLVMLALMIGVIFVGFPISFTLLFLPSSLATSDSAPSSSTSRSSRPSA
jgi:TRAP-type mannitol/chloroaromatic compound transport system permease large subunit